MTDTFTCANCGDTHEKGWSDEEAAAEAQENFPGIDTTDPVEAPVVCDDCYNRIMGRARAEAPELIGPGWQEATREGVRHVLDEAAELGITKEELAREMADMYSMPPDYVPGIGFVSGLAMRMLRESPLFRRPSPDSKCYPVGAGMVHVKPDCRCRR